MRTPHPGDAIFDRGREIGRVTVVIAKDDFAPDAWSVTMEPSCCTSRSFVIVDRAGAWRRV